MAEESFFWNGSTYKEAQRLWVWDGSAWKEAFGLWAWNGSTWNRCYNSLFTVDAVSMEEVQPPQCSPSPQNAIIRITYNINPFPFDNTLYKVSIFNTVIGDLVADDVYSVGEFYDHDTGISGDVGFGSNDYAFEWTVKIIRRSDSLVISESPSIDSIIYLDVGNVC